MITAYKHLLSLVGFAGLAGSSVGLISEHVLPKPNYERKPGDPGWLGTASQFHGHLGPWAVAGVRLGAAGREKVQAEGYFDLEVASEGPFSAPPKRCFLDGIQVATGATWGKGNVTVTITSEVRVSVTNKRTGRRVTVRPTESLTRILTVGVANEGSKPGDEHLDDVARKIAAMPPSQLVAFDSD
jgi:formylmethanofuran dehydrogenase subunit E